MNSQPLTGQPTTASTPLPPALKCSWLWRQVLWLQSKQQIPDFFKDLPAKLHLFHVDIAPLIMPKPLNDSLLLEKTKNGTQPPLHHVVLKNKTQTFNHINYYVLYNGIPWFKSILDPAAQWHPIYFEGISQGIEPEAIQADGANLIIMARKEIYYKKVLEEHRDVATQEYTFKDISEQNNWIPAWFTLPVLEYFQNPFADNHLKLPDGYIGFAISNRAEYCGKVEDSLGVEHFNPLNNTLLYVLMQSSICLYDPYVNISANIELPLPETKTSTFEGLSIAASASTVMLIGYKITPKQTGIAKSLGIFTEFIDHDLIGNNPEITYDFEINAPKPQSFMLPMPSWVEHTLPGKITKEGTIFQNGMGNQARELRIPGWNSKNEQGYFQKKISAKEWKFVPYFHGYTEAEALSESIEKNNETFKTTIKDYMQGNLVSPNLPLGSNISLSLHNYGKNTFSSTINLKIDEISLELLLYKTRGVLNFIFPALPLKYQLVLPSLDHLPDEHQKKIKSIFSNVTSVAIHEEKDTLKITPFFLTNHHFELSFLI